MELRVLNTYTPFGFVVLGSTNKLVDVVNFLAMATSKICEFQAMLHQRSCELCVQFFVVCLVSFLSDFK